MLNELSGPTSHDVPWHPIYSACLPTNPQGVAGLRKCIAWHGVGHITAQATAGVRTMAVRMPSFSDTPHVQVIVPLSTHLPCGGADATQVPVTGEQLVKLCYQLSGYVAEYNLNEGELRDIAGLHDVDSAIELANSIASVTNDDPSRLMAAAITTVEEILLVNRDVCNSMVAQLLSEGYISFADYDSHISKVWKQDLGARMLANLETVGYEQVAYAKRMLR
jgi:hypothetical protein